MAEQNDNATEKPTGKKLGEAHDRGQFAQAPEIQVVAGLLASYFALLFTVGSQSKHIAELTTSLFGNLEKYQITSDSLPGWTLLAFLMLGGLTLPILGCTTLAAILAGGIQSRFKLTSEVLGIKFDKLNPVSGLQRVFSKDGIVKMVLDLAKFVIVGSLIYSGMKEILADPIFFTPVPVFRIGQFIYDSTLVLFFRLAFAMGALAILHYVYQLRKTEKSLMMTRQEVKDENRQAMGDPNVRMAQRAMARRLMQKQMLADVEKADVIITNPTHYAVALKYERGVDTAPVILAKGQNLFAQRIKAIGTQRDIPTVENKPVARALFKYGQVGQPVPAQLYQAIAEILGYVYRTHRYYFHQLKARRLTQ
ncbi:MAG: EscU/YscU/HrcU family type III secretion system export apparatus switch protein [Pseudomonadota bacterium]